MTTFNLAHNGEDYRIEIEDDNFVMLQRADDGVWNIEAQMSIRAAEVLASLGPGSIVPRAPSMRSPIGCTPCLLR